MNRLYLHQDGHFEDVTEKLRNIKTDWFCYGLLAMSASYFIVRVIAAFAKGAL